MVDILSWTFAGPLLVGLVFGFVGGRAVSDGTNAKLLAAIVTLIGASVLFQTNTEIAGMFMGVISIGYFVGVVIGSGLREDVVPEPDATAQPAAETTR